jgi:hypothetical protein
MTNPRKKDVYFTQIKTKYLRGLVETAATSVGTSGVTVTGYCSKVLELPCSGGVTYYIPLFTVKS